MRRIRDDDLYAVIGERDELCRAVAMPVMNVSESEGLENTVTVRGQRAVAQLCGLLGAAWQRCSDRAGRPGRCGCGLHPVDSLAVLVVYIIGIVGLISLL